VCAVIGATEGYDQHKVLMLFKNSRIRGLHAFGYAFVKDGKVKTRKYLEYEKFLNSFTRERPAEFIAHFRYSTSGDWKTLSNNQPLEAEGNALVFNGTLDMRTKTEMEAAYNIKLNTENDGELVLRAKDPWAFIKQDGRTFAGLLLGPNREITPMRNELRPLYSSYDEQEEVTYYASTNDIMKRSGFKNAKLIPPC